MLTMHQNMASKRVTRAWSCSQFHCLVRLMIAFRNVTLTKKVAASRKTIFEEISFELPTDRRVVLFGDSGSGKTTLLNAIAGLNLPDHGEIARHAHVSFPIGYSGGLKPKLTVRQNLAHVATLYGVEPGSSWNLLPARRL